MRAPPKKTPGPIALALALALALSLALVGASSASARPAGAGSGGPRAHVSIVNGVAAEAGTFPWLAVIFHEGEGVTDLLHPGGRFEAQGPTEIAPLEIEVR